MRRIVPTRVATGPKASIAESRKTERKGPRKNARPRPKPVRDKEHPLRVIALCMRGERSKDAKTLIDRALQDMNYGQFVTVSVFHIKTIEQAKSSGFDIVIVPDAQTAISPLRSKKITSLLRGNREKIVNYHTVGGLPIETGETLVTRILGQAGEFLDLRF